MAEILLVNPRKRRTARRKNPVKKRRSAAQKAATRKMIAANRARGGSSRKRRRNPVAAKANPVRRRRRSTSVRRRSSRRRSNPALNIRSVQNQVMEAGIGAIGAIGLGVIQGYLPIPANLKSGLIGTGVKALLAIGMGVVANKVNIVKGPTANKMVNGALTVILYDALKTQLGTFAPGIKMGAYLDEDALGYYGSGYPAGVVDNGMGTYLPDIDSMNMGMEADGLNAYTGEPEYFENMAYS